MRKLVLLLLLLPIYVTTVSGVANAQRKNTTSHDIKKIENKINEQRENIENYKNDYNCDCKHHKKHKKKHHKKHHKE